MSRSAVGRVARLFDRPTDGNMATAAQVVRYFGKFLTALEGTIADLQSQQAQLTAIVGNLTTTVAELVAVQAAAAAAQASADAAQVAADAAQTAANTAGSSATGASSAVSQESTAATLAKSYVSGATITATDAGADVTITISAHTRYYPQPDGTTTSVAVSGGSLTGQAYSTKLYIYYDDPTRAGGVVSYQATISDATAAQVGDRHCVGSVLTPAALAAPITGGTVRAPGPAQIQL